MQVKGATTVIKKQCEFLGMSAAEVIKFAKESPLAQPQKVLEAVKVLEREYRDAQNFFENK